MEPEELAGAIEELIITANNTYGRSVIKVQNELYDAIFLKLKDLELDDSGYIKQNSVNRKILRDTQEQFEVTISTSVYQASLSRHMGVIPKINSLNTEYFQQIKETFSPNKNFLRSLQSQTIKNVNELLLQDGLRAQIKIPLNQILEQNVSTGGDFKGMLTQIKDFITGNDQVEGRLLRYSKTYLKDILFQYSRSFQESITNDLKLNWYSYSGGVIDRTREFCLERVGKYFHRSEIESWAELHWKGKAAGTTKSSIFILLGGHNCAHSLIPVSQIVVPEADLARITQ